jgi:LacI family transcriptional regulator
MTQRTRRAVRIQDVANQAAVSIGTVSRVMNNHPNVEAELRLRVLDAANNLGYIHRPRQTDRFRPHAEESAPPPPATPPLNHIVFCCRSGVAPQVAPELNPYFSLVLQGVEAECRRLGVQLSYRIVEDDVRELPKAHDMIGRSGAEGMLLLNFIDHELVYGMLQTGLPGVLVEHYFPDLPLDSVMNDSYQGGFQAVEYLIQQGHRRIAFVDGLHHCTVERRYDAYRRALSKAGLAFDPAWVLPGNLLVDGGIAAGEEFVRRKLDCTGVFCSSDATAIGFMQALGRHGRRVPDDISIVGFDDIEASRYVSPPLTTIRANAPALGRMAVRQLIARVADPTFPATQTLIHADLIERLSVRRL